MGGEGNQTFKTTFERISNGKKIIGEKMSELAESDKKTPDKGFEPMSSRMVRYKSPDRVLNSCKKEIYGIISSKFKIGWD